MMGKLWAGGGESPFLNKGAFFYGNVNLYKDKIAWNVFIPNEITALSGKRSYINLIFFQSKRYVTVVLVQFNIGSNS